MSDLDKDIKDLNKYISFSKKSENFSHNTDYEWHKELGEKIENVLTELEKEKEKSYKCEYYEEVAVELSKELETYKEIAKRLADIVALNTVPKEECKQCILDWARKEVEKDE